MQLLSAKLGSLCLKYLRKFWKIILLVNGQAKKKNLTNCHHRIDKTKFELFTLDSPVKFGITPSCIIVSEFTLQPSYTFYKLFVLEKICCVIKTLPHLENYFTN